MTFQTICSLLNDIVFCVICINVDSFSNKDCTNRSTVQNRSMAIQLKSYSVSWVLSKYIRSLHFGTDI